MAGIVKDLEALKKDKDFLLLETHEMKRQIGELNNASDNTIGKTTGAYIWLLVLTVWSIFLTIIVVT